MCILWHDAIAGRKAEERDSPFDAEMKQLPDSKQFIFLADNCCAQNKNWTLFSCFVDQVNRTSVPDARTVNYLEVGHTYMRADSIHGNIAKKILRKEQLLNFQDLVFLIDPSNRNIQCLQLSLSDFSDWSSLPDSRLNTPKLNSIRSGQFRPGHRDLFYKVKFEEQHYRSSPFIGQDTVPLPPPRRQEPRGINSKKLVAIKDALLPMMPFSKRTFWESLPSRNVPNLTHTFE